MSTIAVFAAFTQNSGAPATGLTLAEIGMYLTARHKTTGALTVIWDGTQTAAVEITNTGQYVKEYTSADLNTYYYSARASYTGATVLDFDHVTGVYDGVGDEVWSTTARTLTASAAETTAAVSGSTLTIHRGDSWTATLTGLGDISTRTKLWFTAKASTGDTDAEAIIQIEETTGLVYLNGAAGTAAQGSLTVNDAVTGSVTLTLTAAATAQLAIRSSLTYDLQMLTASAVETLTSAALSVTADVTRAVS